MRYKFAFLILSILLVGCTNTTNNGQQTSSKLTEYQEQLLQEGWAFETPSNAELGEEYGVKPVYGLQDNYFDITMGNGYGVAVKIIDEATNRCIRYVLVGENSTETATQIPQGRYYLKLAYGKDWMEHTTDSITLGKFTKNAFYERSSQVYDFGKKNSLEEVNFDLRINVKDATGMNNFETIPISEEEFLK